MSKILITDTETGGFDPLHHSILSFAGVIVEDREIVDEMEILIKEPLLHLDPQAIVINRIALNRLCKEGVPAPEAVNSIRSFTLKHFPNTLTGPTKVMLGGHNVGFDVGFIRRLWGFRVGINAYDMTFSHRLLDTQAVLRFLMFSGQIKLESAGLTDACKYYGVSISETDRHTALGDARATAQLLLEMMVDLDVEKKD